MRSSSPYPLLPGPIELSDHRFIAPTLLGPGLFAKTVEASAVPEWLAEIFHARLHRIFSQVGQAGQLPPLTLMRQHGGLAPLSFLDALAGGDSSGKRWTWIEYRSTPVTVIELVVQPAYASPDNLSSMPFPVQGTRVDDGTGLLPSAIPEWMAALLWRRWKRFDAAGAPASLLALRKVGLAPAVMLDLLLGGRGDGLAHRAHEKHWGVVEEATEAGAAIEDATARAAGADEVLGP